MQPLCPDARGAIIATQTRCSFCETRGCNPATDIWFALKGVDLRPLFAFAGVWRAEQPGIDGEQGAWRTLTMLATGA